MAAEIHLIGNAHIDPAWLWRWPDGLAEIKATFQAALDRMEEFPGYVFTSACACYYEWIEENAPEIFEEIRRRVHEGRWALVGGMWIQPDCNIPSGESFVRQMLYSQRYFRQKFGVLCRVGYNVDSFGHHGMLPQLLKKGGMDYYVFMRPGDHEKSGVGNVFDWKSPDGSRVRAFKIPISYGDWYSEHEGKPEYAGIPMQRAKILETLKLSRGQGIPFMALYGVGNHGGGPTITALREIQKMIGDLGDVLEFSWPEKYFSDLRSLALKVPVVQDDLQHHASGCYSAHSGIKMLNCRAESRLAVAEKIMTTARKLLGFPYDSASLKAAWRQVMFNQFHDILAGTCIQEACEDAMEAFHEALNIAARIGNAALQKITWSVDTMDGQPVARSKETDWVVWENGGRGTPIVVFNPLCFPVRAVITINNESQGVTDTNGAPVPVQKVRGPQLNRNDKYNTLFVADLPSMGYAVYWAYKKKAFDVPVVDSPSAHGTVLENTHLRIEFDPSTGWMSSIRLKASGTEVLEGRGCIPLVIDDSASDTWAHGIFTFKNEAGRFADAEICVLEQGPIRATLRVTNRYRDSVLRQDFSLRADGRDVEVSVKLDLREKHRMIKLSFPVNLDDTRAAYEVPYGFMEKNADGMEEAGQRWVAVTGRLPDGTAHGVSLVNVGKYSFAVDGNDLRMTIARTPIYADHFGTRDEMCEYMDQGVQEFRYVIDPISGGDPAALSRRAMRLNQEPVSVMETYHAGPLPRRHAGIEISHSNILASVFKRSEDDDGYILRCYEAGGIAAGGVEISLFGPGERRWKADFTPQEIKSFFIPDTETAHVQEVNLLEMEDSVMEQSAQ